MSSKLAVVTLGSSANPVHTGHIECLKYGMKKAEELGYQVLWCSIAIAPDGYVNGKMKSRGCGNIPAKERLNLMRILMEEEDSKWKLKPATRAHGSAVELANMTLKDEQKHSVTIFTVVGSDRAGNKMKKKHPGTIHTVCLARSSEDLAKLQNDYKKFGCPPQFHLISNTGPPISSSLIRDYLSKCRDGAVPVDNIYSHLESIGLPKLYIKRLLSEDIMRCVFPM